MSTILQVQNLNAYYGAVQSLFAASFTLEAGTAKVLQGTNGAGKSTTLKAIMGLIGRTADQLLIAGQPAHGLAPELIAGLGVGYVPENRRIFAQLTVAENLQVAYRAAPSAHWNLEAVLEVLPHLKPLLARAGHAISGGEQRMVAVGRALMRNPIVLLLDEPCEGVAPKIADAIASTLELAMRQGTGVLLSESHEGFAQRLGAQVLWVKAGQIQAA